MLSGDDSLTLPLMAIGGRGIISVASNEVPAEMVQMVEAAERNDFATARRWHHKLLPIMQVNFVESSPGPVKFAMAAMGLCEEMFRLPMVSPRQASKDKVLGVLKDLGLPDRRRGARVNLADRITEPLRARASEADKTAAREAFAELRTLLGTGAVRAAEPDATRRPAGASIPGSSRAFCSVFDTATRSTSPPITAAGRSMTRTRSR